MVFVLALLCLGLVYAAWKYPRSRTILLSFAALNLVAATMMVTEHAPYAYTLKPHTTAPGID